MYNKELLKAAVKGVIGWRQNHDPGGQILNDWTVSSSGMYFNDVHPLLSINNVISSFGDDTGISYPAFDNMETGYRVGDIVDDAGNLFIAIKVNGVANDTSLTGFWKPYHYLTERLTQYTEAGIINAVDDWINMKVKDKTINGLLFNGVLYLDGDDNKVVKTSKVVGVVVNTKRSDNVKGKTEQIGLHFDTAQTIDVKIFKKGQAAAVHSASLNYTNANSVQWFDLVYEFDGNSIYYVCYDEDAITGQAIYGEYKSKCKGLGFDGFAVTSDFISGWADDQTTRSLYNYGINLKMTVYCDYTGFISSNLNMFLPVISKRIGMDVLRHMAYNAEAKTNRHSNNITLEGLLYEIDGASESSPGNNRSLATKYDEGLKSLAFDLIGVDGICLPCKRRGLKARAI